MATGMLQEPPNSVHVAHLFPRLGLQHKASRAFEIRDGFQIPQTGHIIHCDAWWVHFVCVHFQTVIKRNVSLLQLKQQLVWSYVQAFHKTGSKSTRRKMNAQTVDRVKHFQDACRCRLIDYRPMFKVYAYKTSLNIHLVFTAPWCPGQKLEYIYSLRHLFMSVFICVTSDSFLSNITPKIASSVFTVNSWPCRSMSGSGWRYLFLEN